MKFGKVLGLSSALCLAALPLAAQETNNVEQLKKQLEELKENLQKIQQQQREQIEALQKQIDALQKAAAANRSDALAAPLAAQSPGSQPSTPWSPSHPISLARAGSACM